jgi:hypothetical protein
LESTDDYSLLKDKLSRNLGIEVVSIIPCFCEVMENMSQSLFVEKDPEHQFSQSIKQLASHFEMTN